MKNKKLTLLLTILLFAVSAVTAQGTKQKPTVLILPFGAENVEQSVIETLFEVFTNELAGTGKAKVIDRSNVDKIKAQHNFQNSEWSNEDKVALLGKALNANMIISGQIISFGEKLIATFRMLDVNTTEIVSSATVYAGNIFELFEKVPETVKKLVGKTESNPTTSTSKTNNKKTYYVGDKGPGGGIIFHIDGSVGFEVSENLGVYIWYKAVDVAKDYRGGGYDDWYLPSRDELNFIYRNLINPGLLRNLQGEKWHWSSYQHSSTNSWAQRFSDGYMDNFNKSLGASVRAVRTFNIE